MPLTSYPQGVASFGMPILGSGPYLTTGQVFFVSSAVGKNAPGEGTDPSRPFATIVYANSQCVANRGDYIFVMPAHAESVIAAGTLALSKAGVTVVGIGNGQIRPVITIGTVDTASITITANSCRLINLIISGTGVDGIDNMIDVTGSDAQVIGCRIVMATASAQADNAIRLGTGGDRFTIRDCEVEGTAGAGGATFILANAAVADLRVENCNVQGYFSTSVFSSTGSNHITNMIVKNCVFRSLTSAGTIFNVTTSSTGLVCDCRLQGVGYSAAGGVVANSTGLKFLETYGFDDAANAVNGVLTPAVGTIS